MLKIVVALLCVLTAAMPGCNSNSSSPTTPPAIASLQPDSLTQDQLIDMVFSDTSGLFLAPVKVTSFDIVKSKSGDYRNVYLTYRNTSNREISAIKFMWKGVDAFNEPAQLGSTHARGYGIGSIDNGIAPGKTDSSTWQVMSGDVKTIINAWPVQVSFADGGSWKLKNY